MDREIDKGYIPSTAYSHGMSFSVALSHLLRNLYASDCICVVNATNSDDPSERCNMAFLLCGGIIGSLKSLYNLIKRTKYNYVRSTHTSTHKHTHTHKQNRIEALFSATPHGAGACKTKITKMKPNSATMIHSPEVQDMHK